MRLGEFAPCEAPRHDQDPAVPVAGWRVALSHPDDEPEFYSLCSDCLEAIAEDLGTTATAGAARL
jgi:hypothetical protein